MLVRVGDVIASVWSVWFPEAEKDKNPPKWGYIPCKGCGLNINALVVTQDGLCPPCRKDRYGKP